MQRALIIDDERLARNELKKLLHSNNKELIAIGKSAALADLLIKYNQTLIKLYNPNLTAVERVLICAECEEIKRQIQIIQSINTNQGAIK